MILVRNDRHLFGIFVKKNNKPVTIRKIFMTISKQVVETTKVSTKVNYKHEKSIFKSKHSNNHFTNKKFETSRLSKVLGKNISEHLSSIS